MHKRYALIALAALLIGSFSSPSYALTIIKKEKINKVAVFPLASYVREDSFGKWKGNKKIAEEIGKSFVKKGIEVAPYDMTEKWLLFSGAIKTMKDTEKIGTPENELIHSQHGPMFQKELFEKISKRQEKTEALTYSMTSQLGRKLGVDAVIRGAIYQYTILPKEEPDLYGGFLPFPLEASGVGYATAKKYEDTLYNPKNMLLLHDYHKAEFPAGENPSSLIVSLCAQNVKTGKIFWKAHFEVPYPEPAFTANLKDRISESIDPLFFNPNKGVIYSSKKK